MMKGSSASTQPVRHKGASSRLLEYIGGIRHHVLKYKFGEAKDDAAKPSRYID